MPVNEKQLLDLLAKCQYKYKDLSKRDVTAALSYFNELTTKIDKHVYANGLAKDLVTLNGTIPVNFRNSTYNIPVQLYLSDSHPYEPPLVYVRPTPDMSINPSANVDSSGRVYLPALNDWRYPTSDLYMLLNLMTIKFSEQTPLYTKVNKTNSTPVTTASISSSGYPIQGNQSMPYPSDNYRPAYPLPNQIPSQPFGSSNLPPYPSMDSGGLPPYPPIGGGFPINPYYPMGGNPPQPLSHLKSNSNSNIGQTRPALPNPYGSATASAGMVKQSVASSYADDTIKPEHYRMSLISAVQDRIRMKYKEMCDVKMGEIDSLRKMRTDLEQSKSKLNQLTNDADNEYLNIKELTTDLKRKTNTLSENMNRLKYRDKASIEDAVITTTPLYRQLLQLFAEELAVQDLIFYLGEGLIHKTLTLDSFLKQIRFLTRKQFILRATIQKAREQAGLPT